MWDVCLEICHFAGHVPAEYVRQLWDLLLKAAWDCALSGAAEVAGACSAAGCVAAGLDAGSSAAAATPAAALEAACAQVARLGAAFFPNEGAFPLAHVALRLEQMSAGLWPDAAEGPAADDPARVARAMRAACAAAGGGGGLAAAGDVVRGVYESLLSARPPALAFAPGAAGLDGGGAAGLGGGGAGGGGGVGGALRGGILRSLAALCGDLVAELEHAPRGAAPTARQAGGLLDLAERCAHDARQLGDGALAADFDAVARRAAACARR